MEGFLYLLVCSYSILLQHICPMACTNTLLSGELFLGAHGNGRQMIQVEMGSDSLHSCWNTSIPPGGTHSHLHRSTDPVIFGGWAEFLRRTFDLGREVSMEARWRMSGSKTGSVNSHAQTWHINMQARSN